MLIFYDTETTGIWLDGLPLEHWLQPKIVQLSAIKVRYDGTIVGEIDRIVKPDNWEIPEAATKVHGISQALAKNEGAPLFDVMKEFNSLVEGVDRLVGYNEAFDNKVVRHALKILKRTINLPEKRSCVMLMARDVVKLPPNRPGGEHRWPNLEVTYEFLFGRKFTGAHTAGADVRATMEVYRELKNRGVNDEVPVTDKHSMSLTSWTEVGRSIEIFRDILDLANDNIERLNSWEANFITDLYSRFLEYGPRIKLTDKQWSILERINERIRT